MTTQNPSHVFSAAGSYNVVLTATNAGGSGVSGPQSVTVSTSAPTTLTLLPNDASYVDSSNPTAVHATTGQLYNQVGAATLRSYLKFNVGGVTGTVTSAKLRLWVTDGTVDGAAWYRITSNSWSQATNTWANAPAVDGVKVGDPGLVPELAWLEIDVTAVVTGNGVYSFATLPTSPDAEKYSAKLDSTRPQLVITTA